MTKRFVLMAMSLAVFFCLPSAPAGAAIVNGAFDSGLAGWGWSWETIVNPTAPGGDDEWDASVTHEVGYYRSDIGGNGERFTLSGGVAHLWAQGGYDVNWSGGYFNVDAKASLYQTFYAKAGDILSFDYVSSDLP